MKKKIAFKKLIISKLNNPSKIVGGDTIETIFCESDDGGAPCNPISTRPLGCPIAKSAIRDCSNDDIIISG
jgi:hypothetical protein